MPAERYTSTGTPLTPREFEIVEQLAEEATEVAHAALKMLRYGKEDTNPHNGASVNYTLAKEVGNFAKIMDLAFDENLILKSDVQVGYVEKEERLRKYTQHLP